MARFRQVGHCNFKGKKIEVVRDDYGKFYVHVDEVTTQSRLTAEEMVRYLLNAMQQEVPNSADNRSRGSTYGNDVM